MVLSPLVLHVLDIVPYAVVRPTLAFARMSVSFHTGCGGLVSKGLADVAGKTGKLSMDGAMTAGKVSNGVSGSSK